MPNRSERDRQADLDWLYGRQSGSPNTGHNTSSPNNGQGYDEPDFGYEHAQRIDRRQLQQELKPAPSTQPAPAPQPAPKRKRPTQAKQKKRRHPIAVILALLVAWVVYLVAVPVHTVSTMTSTNATPETSQAGSHPGTTILLVGTDSREGLSDEEKERLGANYAEGQRADSIMVLYRPRTGKSVLVSLPRDSLVTIPGYGDDKLNAAYSYGGAPLLVETIEANTGLKMDGYLEIGFGGFATLVDAIGGVDVCLDEPMQDDLAHIDLPAGCQTLNGANALGYVRMRYSDPEGDLGRAKRQREIITKIVRKLESPRTILDPIRYWKINKAIGQTLTKGSTTSLPELTAGGLAGMAAAGGKGYSLVVPIADPSGWTSWGASVVIWDYDAANELFTEINSGDTSNLARFEP
uniref:LCP family protein n=1 Tax=Vaginimicrobium propionicum TaxID=1871034 RepID=UPI000970F3B9|nr:LCP family protein [Vaginimicrobium propionicum]